MNIAAEELGEKTLREPVIPLSCAQMCVLCCCTTVSLCQALQHPQCFEW